MKKSDINVLIVEDDKTLQAALVEAVKRKGYKPVAVAKADEAESLVKIKPVHALIVDVMLPGRNGVDLVARLKENLVDGVAVIFTSGIYRDRAFAADAIKKTDALEFYTKPFNIEELMNKLEGPLAGYVDAPKVDLHSLLATPFASHRERRKAFDHIEVLRGYDLPFMFCILMDAESSGHLNIVDADHNIYGVTFAKGALAKVDSENTLITTKKMLIKHGFITELELGELKSKSSGGDLIKSLVEEGLMSPHVPSLIKLETIGHELKKLVGDKELKINFVPDRRLAAEPDNLDMAGFVSVLHDMIDQMIPPEWLKKFYAVWSGHPIRLGPQFSDLGQMMGMPVISRVPAIIDLLKKELTVEDLLTQCAQYKEADIFRALHFLMVRRMLVFEEVRRVKNVDEHVNRLKAMHAELKSKSPTEIFKYFGLSENPKIAEVVTMYKEFAKSHHPDTLPQAVSKDIRDLNHELFSKVTAAYEIFSNDQKREKYFNELKQKEAELQIQSDELVTSAQPLLTRGKYAAALPLLQKAVELYASERSLLHSWWVRFKVEGQVKAEEVPQIEKKMRAMSPGTRKTAVWIFVNGLVKKQYGDLKGAENEFNKTLALEESFMDARRELANLKSIKPAKMSTEDILKGDISSVVKGLFNRKKGA